MDKLRVYSIAQDFSKVLRSWLTELEMARIVYRNKMETDSRICHSHDFCDANEAMLEAVEKNGLNLSMVINDQEGQELWGEAWSMAKKSGFDPIRILKDNLP